MTADGLADSVKVDDLWGDWLSRSGGPFLFGQWSIADAMYAPVVTRFVTYAIPRSKEAQGYIDRMQSRNRIWRHGLRARRKKHANCHGRIRLKA